MATLPDDEIYHNLSFPLPYRVLFLIGFGILGWATNVHALDYNGVDVVAAMELRVEPTPTVMPVHHSLAFSHSKAVGLYQSTYRLFLTYSGFCTVSWLLFRIMTHGDASLVDKYGYVPVVTALVIIFVLMCPYNIAHKTERDKFCIAVRRCLFPGPIYFSDVVLADIGTSFAKVFGDIWQSLWMLKPGNSILTPPVHDTWLRWILPTMMSIPFFLRFRQCIVEYTSPENESRRPLYNALKYATSFPVIYLSAAQRLVIADLVREKGRMIAGESWHGEHPLFRLWLLAAVVNSLYSFWWDVTNDWGLDLLRFDPPQNHDRQPPRPLILGRLHSTTPLLNRDIDSNSSDESNHPVLNKDTAKRRYRQSCHGLRTVLLYPRFIYPVLLFINLLLRMTWSVKLSTHVQSPRDGSFTFFWLEVAEVVRRWLWVFIRVEWEVIKKGEEKQFTAALDDRSGDEDGFEMLPSTPDVSLRSHQDLFEE